MKITINPLKNTSLEISAWNVTGDNPRVSLDTEDFAYSIVQTEEGVFAEVWSLSPSGEHFEQVQLIKLNS